MGITYQLSALASAMAMGWPAPEFPNDWQPGGYHARRSAKKRAIHRARTGRK